MQELHDGPTGGNFGGNITTHKILHASYYWPTIFKDAHEHARKCKTCETADGREKKPAFPLHPVNIQQPFEQWRLDIIGEIVPNSSKQHKYILIATDYFTKWVEAIPLKITKTKNITNFIDQYIITRFGLPTALMFDNASYFFGNTMVEFSLKRNFKLKYSSNYYPQDIITQKASIGSSHFALVYEKEVVLHTKIAIPSLALVQLIDENSSSSLQARQFQILKLEEEIEKDKVTHFHHKKLLKASFGTTSASHKTFEIGDLVLKWDKAHGEKGKHTKFQRLWLGPFQIIEKIGRSTFLLHDLSGRMDSLPINGKILKKYFS
eukprot:PITA_18126